jgi:hypothetical protein
LGGGLAKYDGVNWTVYNTKNSELLDNHVLSIAIDDSGNKWIGTYNGLAKYDGSNWIVYHTSNSGLPHNWIQSIAIDQGGNRWIGTHGGLAKYDGLNWIVYHTSNSGLPSNNVQSIVIDGSGNKWIGTGYGLAVFHEGGIVGVKERINAIPSQFAIRQNYPNPFNPSTKIRCEIRDLGFITLKVFDVLGREVATLINDVKQPGSYDVEWNAQGVPSGVYFYRIQTLEFIQTKKMILIR